MRAIGITEFLDKSFDVLEFEGAWLESFGLPEKSFTMSLCGDSGSGKTEFSVQLTKLLAKFGKVLYCSYEQGISKSLQDALKRNDLKELKGSVMFTSGGTFDDLVLRLKKRASARFCIIDSTDYMNLTTAQYKLLKKLFPRKSFIVVSWGKNDKPKTQAAKDIEFMCCIKVVVKNYIAFPRSRFGGNKPFIIWDKKVSAQGELF